MLHARTLVPAGMALALMTACTDTSNQADGLSEEQRAAYEACLDARMTLAISWEAIEAACLAEARGDETPSLPDAPSE